MKRSQILLTALLGAAMVALPSLSRAAVNKGVENSPHDFSTNSAYASWNTRKGVCSVCHSAHNSDPSQLVPLWSHGTSTATFQMYSSPSLNATMGAAPDGVSLACLSCHDGSLAINQGISGWVAGTNSSGPIDASAQIGPDLHNTHPISFVYDAALATADGGLENPVTYHIGDTKSVLTVNTPPVPATWDGTSLTGLSIDQALLRDHKMQCSSCHDVHKLVGSAPSSGILVKISGTDTTGRGSLICRTCHIK